MLTIPGQKGNANQNTLRFHCTRWNGHHPEHHHQQMLTGIWGKMNLHVLLVGMYASATTLENNVEAS
jgi:hypothetical protein